MKVRGHVADFCRGGEQVVRNQLSALFSPNVEEVLRYRFQGPWVLNVSGHVRHNLRTSS